MRQFLMRCNVALTQNSPDAVAVQFFLFFLKEKLVKPTGETCSLDPHPRINCRARRTKHRREAVAGPKISKKPLGSTAKDTYSHVQSCIVTIVHIQTRRYHMVVNPMTHYNSSLPPIKSCPKDAVFLLELFILCSRTGGIQSQGQGGHSHIPSICPNLVVLIETNHKNYIIRSHHISIFAMGKR